MKKTFSDQRAAYVMAISLAGICLTAILSVFFKESTVIEGIRCFFGLIWVTGCIMMGLVYKDNPDKLTKLSLWSALAVVGLVALEACVDWLAKTIYGLTLPSVAIYYIITFGSLFLAGMIAAVIRQKKERAELKKMFN